MKVIVQDLAIEYRDEGHGPLILMLHGWMNSLASFNAITEDLARDYRVVRVDLPGLGGSEPPPKPWFVEDYVRFVLDFEQKIGIKPLVLIGHSFGGRVIMKGVGTRILETGKVVFIDSAGNARRNTPGLRLLTLIAKTGKTFAYFVPNSWYTAMRRRLYKHTGSDYLEAGALSQTFLNTINEDLVEYAGHINVPTLLIWGERDTTTPLEDGKRLASEIPNSQLQIIPGAAHAPHREHPDEVARLIREFV